MLKILTAVLVLVFSTVVNAQDIQFKQAAEDAATMAATEKSQAGEKETTAENMCDDALLNLLNAQDYYNNTYKPMYGEDPDVELLIGNAECYVSEGNDSMVEGDYEAINEGNLYMAYGDSSMFILQYQLAASDYTNAAAYYDGASSSYDAAYSYYCAAKQAALDAMSLMESGPGPMGGM